MCERFHLPAHTAAITECLCEVLAFVRMNWITRTGFILFVIQSVFSSPRILDLEMFQSPATDPCVNNSVAVKCLPDFENVAFGKDIIASSTCGSPPSSHCLPKRRFGEFNVLTEGGNTDCFICDTIRRYPSTYLTDLHNQNNETCWVSQRQSDIVNADNVTLTLSFGKKFEITYISLQFCSKVPDLIAILKSKDFGKTWIPFQYYSNDCISNFNVSPDTIVSKANEQEVLCSEFFNKLSPQYGTRVAFSTLKERPSSYHFQESPVLQDWVTATDIKVVFKTSPKTGPALIGQNGSESTKQNAFYSVSNFAVGGRCKCNGHASKCIINREGRTVCDCKHNTEGDDCEKCKPFHLDRPWARASKLDAHECVGKLKMINFLALPVQFSGGLLT